MVDISFDAYIYIIYIYICNFQYVHTSLIYFPWAYVSQLLPTDDGNDSPEEVKPILTFAHLTSAFFGRQMYACR